MPLLMRMSSEFLNEAKILDNATFNLETTYDTLEEATLNPAWFGMIGFIDETAAGMVIARRIKLFFSLQNVACDVVFFVRPAYRGSILIRRLVKSYETWAFEDSLCVGAQLNAFAGEDNERGSKLATALGFPKIGHINYKKRK